MPRQDLFKGKVWNKTMQENVIEVNEVDRVTKGALCCKLHISIAGNHIWCDKLQFEITKIKCFLCVCV